MGREEEEEDANAQWKALLVGALRALRALKLRAQGVNPRDYPLPLPVDMYWADDESSVS